MSRDQLLKLVNAAEANPRLRRHLRQAQSWPQWLDLVQRLGFRIHASDLLEAQRSHQAARCLEQSQLPPIRPLAP